MEQYSVQIMDTVRLLLSTACGFAIGFERQNHIRQQHRKSAGMRTHMLVCLASAAMMLVSKYGFMDVLVYGDNVRVDVSRVAAAIVSGVGFLGAGIIYVRRESIKGLTTSAGLWATAAVGMAVGCGMYFVGIVLTVLIVIIQELSKISLYRDEEKLTTVVLELDNDRGVGEQVVDWLKRNDIEVHAVRTDRVKENGIQLTLRVYFGEQTGKDLLLRLQSENPAVRGVKY